MSYKVITLGPTLQLNPNYNRALVGPMVTSSVAHAALSDRGMVGFTSTVGNTQCCGARMIHLTTESDWPNVLHTLLKPWAATLFVVHTPWAMYYPDMASRIQEEMTIRIGKDFNVQAIAMKTDGRRNNPCPCLTMLILVPKTCADYSSTKTLFTEHNR